MSATKTTAAEPERECEDESGIYRCLMFLKNWPKIDNGLKMAAANGTATNADPIAYCPWCGGKMQ